MTLRADASGQMDATAQTVISMTEFALELQDITCTFRSSDGAAGKPAQGYTAVGNATLRIRAGEFVSVAGPTGCGKSTLLNIGAGLLAPSLGSVRVFGELLEGINKRAGYMFQTEALMP
ncbi:MAG: mannosyltransferase [Polaromonas sp.]|nr:mannosyltransferase [Polaromonas sp.]